jgi:hypothetical protein
MIPLKKEIPFMSKVDRGTPENPVCSLNVIDQSYRDLNAYLKWLAECVQCCAAALGCTLPEKPDTSGKTFTAKSAGWGNGNKLA